MNAKKKRSLLREQTQKSRGQYVPQPRLPSVRRPSPLKTIHPPAHHTSLHPQPLRPAHPISPPGRRRVSSSVLAFQTAQKHLVRVEGTRARQHRMWREAGVNWEMRGAPATRPRAEGGEEGKKKSVSCLPCKRVEGLGPRG